MPQLFCSTCCKTQEIDEAHRCTLCHTVVEPPKDPTACPRSSTGAHNPFDTRTAEGWICSLCNAKVSEPAGTSIEDALRQPLAVPAPEAAHNPGFESTEGFQEPAAAEPTQGMAVTTTPSAPAPEAQEPAPPIGTCLDRGQPHWLESHNWKAKKADLYCGDCYMPFIRGQERLGRTPPAEA